MADLSGRLAGLSPAKRRLLEQRLQRSGDVPEPIAIVGMACRFPGAGDLDAYWRLIRDGIGATGEIPASRWDVDALYDPTGDQPGKMSVRWAGLIDDVDKFDPQFFGISPREATRMDPQQRLLLEVGWEALEVASLAPQRMCGTATGVFIGIGGTDYSKIPSQFEDYYQHIDAHVGTGNALSIAANRLSYILDLRGPSVSVDTACSSGLIGVHMGVQSLRNRECDTALAGGVNLILSPETTIAFSKARMLSPDGCCRPFDAGANGYVRGEGCGILVLKRLTDAVRAGDRVMAVIRATAANQDGRTSGLTAPNGRAQQAVIRAALGQAGLTPDRVGYVEAHGTGTPLGDPIETGALAAVFRRRRDDEPPCYVTSVKANIGHTETVSGIAGIIKVVLMMQHHLIPAQLYLETLNPHLSLDGARLCIPKEPVAWEPGRSSRIAGVSSFGFGGTNVHVVLEEASPHVPPSPTGVDRPVHLLALSAKTESALASLAGRYAEHLEKNSEDTVADVCYAANVGRSHFQHRAAVTAQHRADLQERLHALRDGKSAPGLRTGRRRGTLPPKVAFLFTGQGSQYVGMGRALYETQPIFRKTLQRCEECLRDSLDRPLTHVLFDEDGCGPLLDETAYTQPALFALEYSLARLWQSWGIEPSVLIGHSVGEYVAACVAEVFNLEDGLRLIARRASLIQQLPRDGLMAVVFASEERVERELAPYRDCVCVAAKNGPENTVISGSAEAVRALVERFSADSIGTQLLRVSHAFHSPLTEPILDDFRRAANQFSYRQPQLPLVSNLTGRLIGEEPMDADYWCRHIRHPVLLTDGMRTLAEQELNALLEIGPAASLLSMGRRCLPEFQVSWLPSLRKGRDEWSAMLDSLAQLYLLGATIDWPGFDRDYPRRRLVLPTYPFERQRYWFDAQKTTGRIPAAGHGPILHPLLGRRVPTALPTRLLEVRLSCRAPKYLADHQVQGSPVFPAAGYVEQALAAAEQVFGEGRHVVENLSIQQAMFLPEGTERVVEMTVPPESAGRCSFEVYSVPLDGQTGGDPWAMHASGVLRHRDTEALEEPATVDVAGVQARALSRETHEGFYDGLMRSRGLVYGPAFQLIHDLHRAAEDAVCELRLPPEILQELDQYHLHPALGDALFQTTAGIIPLEPDGSYSPYTYMPMSVRRARLLGTPGGKLYVYAVRRSPGDRPSPEVVESDVFLLDENGRALVEMAGVRVQRVGRAGSGQRELDVRQWLYDVEWLPATHAAGEEPLRTAADAGPGRWLIFADRCGVAAKLAERLSRAGNGVVLVEPADVFHFQAAAEAGGADVYRINPLDGDDYRRLLREAFGSDGQVCRGVVHLWSLDVKGPDEADGRNRSRRLGCGGVLQLMRQLARFSFSKTPRLYLATQAAQSVTDDQADVAVAQSPLWGLGRTAALEHPELACCLIDFDSVDGAGTIAEQLEGELRAGREDDQLAYRNGRRLAPRLRRTPDLLSEGAAEESGGPLQIPRQGPFRLRLGTPGSFDSLRYDAFEREPPGPGQVEIRVSAAGLNFSDVLKAMGLYPGLTDEIVPLGIECGGVVTAVGDAVERFRVGDAVMGVVPYSFASHALTAEYALVHKPLHLTDVEASTIPITFLTAYYALVRLACLQPGERVLIHAGAGGVGLAAIQIAQHIGAEVFSTAGSDQKRDHLRSIGVGHVFNSRTLEFAEQILEVTGRQGVDVVLNSLSGDAITKSLSILRAYGRFLEIGKTDIYQNRMIGLSPFQDNLSYFAIDLDRLLRQRPGAVRDLFAQVMEHVEERDYRPLLLTEFPAEETADAFRYMAQRKNTGKVVIVLHDSAMSVEGRQAPGREGEVDDAERVGVEGSPIRPNGTYLITGGLGALGLQLADWLDARGATHLVLLARRAPSESATARLDALHARGVEVAVLRGDVADAQSLIDALNEIPAEFPPLRGVIHAAGVLDDGVLFEMGLEQLHRPMAPKVQGAWNLHEATRGTSLDFFVLFSSVASVLGSPGQANYAAGNAFLDALAALRRRQGLPAVSINWGPWAESGMAAEAGRADQLESRGMGLLPPQPALELLEKLLHGGSANVAVMDVRWPEMLRTMAGRVPPLLRELADQEGTQDTDAPADQVDDAFRRELLAASPEARTSMLRDHFADELSRIMGIDREQMDMEQPLGEIGMDSLLAMELKGNLERRLAFTLPLAAFLEHPSVTSLAAHAAKALIQNDGEPGGETAAETARDVASWSPLVALQADGDGSALFCVHPLGGDVECYRDFARRVRGRPVYGLRGRGNDGRFPPHESMAELVQCYLDAMQRIQPRGPYHLTSWSAGGIFAYALARALREREEEVGLLMLFDTPLPSIYDNVRLDDDVRFLFDLGKFANWFAGADIDVEKISYDELRAMDESTRWDFALQIAKTHGAVPPDASAEHIRRVVEAAKSHATMIMNYRLEPIDQPVHLVRPEQPDVLGCMTGQTLGPDLGWTDVVGDRLRLHTAPGDHFSMIKAGNADRLAELALAAAESIRRSDGAASPAFADLPPDGEGPAHGMTQ